MLNEGGSGGVRSLRVEEPEGVRAPGSFRQAGPEDRERRGSGVMKRGVRALRPPNPGINKPRARPADNDLTLACGYQHLSGCLG